jgi:hypothetical protein
MARRLRGYSEREGHKRREKRTGPGRGHGGPDEPPDSGLRR